MLPQPPLHITIFNYIKSFTEKNGYPPTIREVARVVCASGPTVHYNMKKLENMGWIERYGYGRGARILHILKENY